MTCKTRQFEPLHTFFMLQISSNTAKPLEQVHYPQKTKPACFDGIKHFGCPDNFNNIMSDAPVKGMTAIIELHPVL